MLSRESMKPEHAQIVVGFDFSASSRIALQRGIAVVTSAPVHVLNVACILDPHSDITYADEVRDRIVAVVEAGLRETQASSVHFNVHVRIARHPAREICDVAQEVGADLIIVGNRGRRGLERLVAGSVSEHVVRDARCEVMVAREKSYDDVELDEIVEVEPHAHSYGTHRYSYEDHRAMLRPSDWPMY